MKKSVAAVLPALCAALLGFMPVSGIAFAQTASAAPATPAAGKVAVACSPLMQQRFNRLQDESPQDLCQYAGKVTLVVNTASYCGFTQQYEGLEALYAKYQAKGLVVLGFPSNDFGGQEPGSSGEIAAFCKKNYGVSFPMFEKLVTKGPAASAIYELLARKHGPPAWNFHKYLVGKDGAVRAAFPSAVGPEDAQLALAIDKALAE